MYNGLSQYCCSSCFCTVLIILSSHQTSCVPLEEFFQFGAAAGDTSLPKGDDNLVQLNLAVDFHFFAKTYTTVHVETDGIITFGTVVAESTPSLLTFPQVLENNNVPIVAPFWADVDTTAIGQVWYRLTDESTAIDKVKSIVADAFGGLDFVASQLIIVTWAEVGYSGEQNTDIDEVKNNTFQCVLASDGSSTIAIFLYAEDGINWTTGDFHDGQYGLGGLPAQVGFDAGDQVHFKMIEGALSSDVINIDKKSNVKNPGLFVFQVDQIEIQEPPNSCPLIGSNDCKEKILQVACSHISMTADKLPKPCEERV